VDSIPFDSDGLDQFALMSGVSHSERHSLVAAETTSDLAVGALVEPERYLDQMDTVVMHYRHKSIVVVEDRGFVWNFR
jgi:hypothetical protein